MKKKATKPTRRPHGRYVMGARCVQEVLLHAPERIRRVFLSEGLRRAHDIQKELQEKELPWTFLSKIEMEALVDSQSHQGMIALLKDQKLSDFNDWLQQERSKGFLLCLDAIQDPQNLGALLRAAECFAVDAVLWSKNRTAPLTPTVAKASVGASELVPNFVVSNLADSLRRCEEAGYSVIAADMAEDAVALRDFEWPEKTALLVGSEGSGIQPLLKKRIQQKVQIPLHGKISSLNVSQATTLLLAHWRHEIA